MSLAGRTLLPPLLGAVLVLATAAGAGCHWLESSTGEGKDEGEDPAKGDLGELAEQVDAKLRAYASCRHNVASVMDESWERYSDQVDEGGVPRRKRQGVYLRGIGSNTFRGCRRILASAPRTPPPMPKIAEHAEALVEASAAYAALTRKLERYTDEEGYADDDWATLAELDPKLRELHEAWAKADAALDQAIDARHVENDPLLLGVLERGRSPLEFATRALMVHSRALIRCQTREPPPEPDDCKPAFEKFDKAYGRFDKAYAADRAEADKVFWMSTFAKDAEEFHELAADVQTKLGRRSGKELDTQGLVDEYASLVRDAETLDFDFP